MLNNYFFVLHTHTHTHIHFIYIHNTCVTYNEYLSARLAQMVERMTINDVVAGAIAAVGEIYKYTDIF